MCVWGLETGKSPDVGRGKPLLPLVRLRCLGLSDELDLRSSQASIAMIYDICVHLFISSLGRWRGEKEKRSAIGTTALLGIARVRRGRAEEGAVERLMAAPSELPQHLTVERATHLIENKKKKQ